MHSARTYIYISKDCLKLRSTRYIGTLCIDTSCVRIWNKEKFSTMFKKPSAIFYSDFLPEIVELGREDFLYSKGS